MTANVGTVDRLLRAALGVALLVLAFAGLEAGLARYAAALVGVVMLGVAASRVCPVYTLLGVKTRRAAG